MWILAAAMVLFCLLLPVQGAHSGAYVQETGSGWVNWMTGEVRAKGEASRTELIGDDAARERIRLRQARINGQRNLYEALQSVRINSSLTVADLLANNDHLRRHLRGIASNAEVVEETVSEEGKLAVSLRANLWGPLSEMLIPDSVWYEDSPRASAPQEEEDSREEEGYARARTYTGLVVDARGLDLEPALVCRVYGSKEELLYGPGVVRPSIAIGQGMAAYMRDLDRAMASARTGSRPLLVQAQERVASYGAEFTVSEEAREMIAPGSSILQFLREGRVVILLGQEGKDQPREYHLEQ